MDEWENFVFNLSEEINRQNVSQILEKAKAAFKDNLTGYEIKCILDSPVNLIRLIAANRLDNMWSSVIAEMFDFLSDVVSVHSSYMDDYLKPLIKICLVGSFSEVTRRHALHCLSTICRQPTAGVYIESAIPTLIDIATRNNESASCRSAVFEALGNISLYHPELLKNEVDSHLTSLWRTCQLTLERGMAPTLTKGVIHCIDGIYKSFGDELHTSELTETFKMLKRICDTQESNQKACLALLWRHSRLYPEQMRREREYRDCLWQYGDVKWRETTADCAEIVYDAITTADNIKEIVMEIWQHFETGESHKIVIFMRAMATLLDKHQHTIDRTTKDAYSRAVKATTTKVATWLERRLRDAAMDVDSSETNWEYEHKLVENLEQAAACVIYGGSPNETDMLVILAIAALHLCPQNRRTSLLAHPVLYSCEKNNSIILHLILETCKNQDGDLVFDRHLNLWREIFDTKNGQEKFVMKYSKHAFDEYFSAFADILNSKMERSPTKMASLFNLTAVILTLDHDDAWLAGIFEGLVEAVCEFEMVNGFSYGLIELLAVLIRVRERICNVLSMECKEKLIKLHSKLSLFRSVDERSLCAVAKTFVYGFQDNKVEVLNALDVIFSRKSVDSDLLLHCLDLLGLYNSFDNDKVANCVAAIKKFTLKQRGVSDNRLVRKKALLSMSKISKAITSYDDNTVSDSHSINITKTYKISLQTIIYEALKYENFNILKHLMLVIKSDDAISVEILHKICVCLARGEGDTSELSDLTVTAVRKSDSPLSIVKGVLESVKSTKYPGARKFLCAILEVVLEGNLLNKEEVLFACVNVIKECCRDDALGSKMAAVDLAGTVFPFLKNSNALIMSNLEELLLSVGKINSFDITQTYEVAIDVAIEKAILFDDNKVENLIEKLFAGQPKLNSYDSTYTYTKITDLNIKLLKSVSIGNKLEKHAKIFIDTVVKEDSIECLYRVTAFKKYIECDVATLRGFFYVSDSRLVKIFERIAVATACSVEGFSFRVVYEFLVEFGELLLEMFFQKTINILYKIITLHPTKMLKKYESLLMSFVNKHDAKIRSMLTKQLSEHTAQINLTDVTRNLENICRGKVANDNVLNRLVVISKCVDATKLVLQKEQITKWPTIIKDNLLRELSMDRDKMAYLSAAMTVCLWFMRDDEVIAYISDDRLIGDSEIGFVCCSRGITAFAPFFLERPRLLQQVKSARELRLILLELLKHCNQNEYDRSKLNLIFDTVWSKLANELSVDELKELFVLFSNDSKVSNIPASWVLDTMASDIADLNVKTLMMDLLPEIAVDDVNILNLEKAVKSFTDSLPLKLSEMTTPEPVESLFRALVLTEHPSLVKPVIKCCLEDKTGWWDAIIEKSIEALAKKNCVPILNQLLDILISDINLPTKLSILKRLLLPLLENAKTLDCERFFEKHLETLLHLVSKELRCDARASQFILQRLYTDFCIGFSCLSIVFVKLSDETLEPFSSVLYRSLRSFKPESSWWLLRTVCKYSVATRSKITLPLHADDVTKEYYRQFQCASYNCLASAILKKGPEASKYKSLFDKNIFDSLVHPTKIYQIPLRARKTNICRAAVITNCQTDMSNLSFGSVMSSRRDPLFYKTLSDNVLKYDFLKDEVVEEDRTVFLVLSENELNKHECAPSLTAILKCMSRKMAADDAPPYWIVNLADVICGGRSDNARMLVAQAVCNSSAELAPHAIHLVSPLLQFIEARIFDGLSCGILEAVCDWCEKDDKMLNASVKQSMTRCLASVLEDKKCVEMFVNILLHLFDRTIKIVGGSEDLCTNISLYLEDLSKVNQLKFGLKILKMLQENGFQSIQLSERLITILEGKRQGTCDYVPFKMAAEAYGRAIDTCKDDDIKMAEIHKFNKVLLPSFKSHKLDAFVDLLYNVQNTCTSVCDETNIGAVIDAASKMPRDLRRKCVKILTTYVGCSTNSSVARDVFAGVNVEEMLCSESYSDLSVELINVGLSFLDETQQRRYINIISGMRTTLRTKIACYRVLVKASKEYLSKSGNTEPPLSKRPRMSGSAPSALLSGALSISDQFRSNLYACLSEGLADPDVSRVIFDDVEEFLTKDDLGNRFCECLLLVSCDAAMRPGACRSDSRGRIVAILRLLFANLRRDPEYRESVLYEDTTDDECSKTFATTTTPQLSRILSRASLHQGSFASRVKQTNKRTANKTQQSRGKRLLLDDFVEDLINFCEENENAAIETYLSILAPLLRNGDFPKQTLAEVVARCISTEQPCVVLMLTSRLLTNDLRNVISWQDKVQSLRRVCRGTELEPLSHLIWEDFKMADFRYDAFWDSTTPPIIDYSDDHFTVEGLMSTFGELSNWDLLTIEQRRNMNDNLPPIWCCQDTFNEALENALVANKGTDIPDWMQAMVSVMMDKDTAKLNQRLLQANSSPVNYFQRSAVAESMEWSERKCCQAAYKFDPQQCLGMWAARLMLRRQIATRMSEAMECNVGYLTSEYEWCKTALKFGVTAPVLECIKNSIIGELAEGRDLMPWLTVQTRAEFLIAKRKGDTESLLKIAEHADEFYDKCKEKASESDRAEMNLTLVEIRVEKCLADLVENNFDLSGSVASLSMVCDRVDALHSADVFSSKAHAQLMGYYDAVLERGIVDLPSLWPQLNDCLVRILEKGIRFDSAGAVSIALMRVYDADDDILETFLTTLERQCVLLEPFAVDALSCLKTRENLSRSSRYILERLTSNAAVNGDVSKWLSKIRIPSYSLKQYCETLMLALKSNDVMSWNRTHEDIHDDLTNSEGAAYRLLKPHLDKLEAIQNYSNTEDFQVLASRTLEQVLSSVCRSDLGATVMLEDLCPALARASARGGGVPMFGDAVYIDKEVRVLPSLRRPCLFTARTSDGRRRRWLVKSHDDVRVDAFAQRMRELTSLVAADGLKAYKVIPLSKNCGLIEWLDVCETLRSIITKNFDLNEILLNTRRESDQELMRTSAVSTLTSYKDLRSKVPRGILRTSIEKECWCYQQFWRLRREFLKSLASMSVMDWLLGIGDRHLENILMCKKTGQLVSIDNSEALGTSLSDKTVVELPPARLTPAMLTVALEGLEASMQSFLTSVRENFRSIASACWISLAWHPSFTNETFRKKLKRLRSKMSGELTSYACAYDELSENVGQDKALYLELLRKVSPCQTSRIYSIEEQVSSLIQMATNEQILSVTRAGWEPWV